MSTSERDRNVPPGIKDEKRRTITNKNSGETITWNTYGYESEGREAAALLVCKPGGGPPIHYHTTYAERFEAVEGEMGVLLGKDLGNLETVHLKPGEGAD